MHVWQRRAFASLPLLFALIALAAAPSTCTGGQDATTKVTRGRLTARTHDLLRGMGNARRMRGAVVPKRFLYVYEMPPEFTTDLEALPVQWHPEQYDFDQVCTATSPGIAPCLTSATCTPSDACVRAKALRGLAPGRILTYGCECLFASGQQLHTSTAHSDRGVWGYKWL